MERFISVQNNALNDTHARNALLVSSNSELRMFLSFMPIKYREYVGKLRAESNILYRQQRISPKVIQPNDKGTEIQSDDAQMSDPTVQYALRDAEYATLGAARSTHGERNRFAQTHPQRPLHESVAQTSPTRGSTSSAVPAQNSSEQVCTYVC